MTNVETAAERARAYLVATREDFEARVVKARAALPNGIESGILCGPVQPEIDMWEFYESDQVLYHSSWFYPFLMWALRPELRWPYVKRYEEAVIKLILSSVGGSVLSFSEGFAPGYDAKIHVAGRDLLLECKTTDHHDIFIEGGREDRSQSGLSSTESDVYAILSRDQPFDKDGRARVKGKLRLAFTHMLYADYERLAQNGKEVLRSGFAGPGTYGVYLNPARDMKHHIWLGDVKCKVDVFGHTKYNMDSFVQEPSMKFEAREKFKNGIELMEKMADRNKEQE